MNGPPGNAEGRPDEKAPHEANNNSASITVAKQLRNRRAAAWRSAPFDEFGHRDPIDLLADEVRGIVPWLPFGLPEEVRRRHGNDLVETWGWSLDEVEAVLKVRPRVAA